MANVVAVGGGIPFDFLRLATKADRRVGLRGLDIAPFGGFSELRVLRSPAAAEGR